MARVESNPDRAECTGEPECDEVSWSVSLGCLAESERNVVPAGKAALLTSELSHLTLRTYLFTFHREKKVDAGWFGELELMQGKYCTVKVWEVTTTATTTAACSLFQNACVGHSERSQTN